VSLLRAISPAAVLIAVVALAGVVESQRAWSQVPLPGVSADDDKSPSPPSADFVAMERAYRAERNDRMRAHIVGDMGGIVAAIPLLAEIVEKDPSDDVALAATYALRRTSVGALAASLERRLQSGTRDQVAHDRLTRELERHQLFASGQNLPHFLREAPPVFSLDLDKKHVVRILAFGDFGDGSPREEHMAEAMRRFHRDKPFDLALTLGDNFYPVGVASPDDAHFQRDFVRLYEPMHVRFFPTLGNHDWVLPDSPAAEVLHSAKSKYWQMPAIRYTFVAGSVQFFAIDTNLVSRAELEWLDHELTHSTARWKIVYGHHPIYSNGAHGDEPVVRDNVLPLLRGRANIYLCGHEHDLQHLAPEGGVHFVIVGGGGAQPRPTRVGPRTLFAASRNGFAVIEASRTSLSVNLLGEDLKSLHRFSLGD
jgi:tartrate-resistant acid phosphatase type 5